MNRIPLLRLTVSLLIASSALGQSINCEFTDNIDFSKFKTYQWVTFNNGAPIDKLTDEQIRAAVDAALAKKGLSRVTDGTADLLIDYQSRELIDEKFSKAPTSDEKPWIIYAGDLGIDMYTPANHKLVWRGVASKTLDPKAKSDKRQKNLNKAAAKLINTYPPSGKGPCRVERLE